MIFARFLPIKHIYRLERLAIGLLLVMGIIAGPPATKQVRANDNPSHRNIGCSVGIHAQSDGNPIGYGYQYRTISVNASYDPNYQGGTVQANCTIDGSVLDWNGMRADQIWFGTDMPGWDTSWGTPGQCNDPSPNIPGIEPCNYSGNIQVAQDDATAIILPQDGFIHCSGIQEICGYNVYECGTQQNPSGNCEPRRGAGWRNQYSYIPLNGNGWRGDGINDIPVEYYMRNTWCCGHMGIFIFTLRFSQRPPADSPPSLSTGADCSNQRVIANTSDPDGGDYDYYFQINGGGWQGQHRSNPSINMSGYNQYDIHTVRVVAWGVRPPGQPNWAPGLPRDQTVTYGLGGARACRDRTFTVTPNASDPSLQPDSEAPTTAVFSSSRSVAYGPPGSGQPSPGINVTVTRSFYIRRGALQIPLAPTPETDNSRDQSRNYSDTRSLPPVIVGDRICVNIRVQPSSGTVDTQGNVVSGGGTSADQEKCSAVANKPYLKIFGGGVWAGGAFAASDGTCSGYGDGRIITYARYNNGQSFGSSAQYATLALNQIEGNNIDKGFFSASQKPPNTGYLTFANAGFSSSNWGGNFGGGRCLPDFYDSGSNFTRFAPGSPNTATIPGAAVNINTLTDGFQYQRNGNLTINAGPVTTAKRVTIYVDGDVRINTNIVYPGTYTPGAPTSYPYVSIIARGNIYIDRFVTSLSGLYVAQPNGAVGGQIYTCSSGFTPVSIGNNNNNFTQCNTAGTPLNINGAFIAKKVNFHRSNGSLRSAQPAVTVRTCLEWLRSGVTTSGVYPIDPDGSGGNAPFNVYCDQTTDGGGWTVFQRRTSNYDFYRDWNSYVNGFGNIGNNYWLGNDKISAFTSQFNSEMRVDMRYNAQSAYAKYSYFTMDIPANNYKLRATGYTGNAGDGLYYHSGRAFTTRDRDNDYYSPDNCANLYTGAWWYGACHISNLNGQWGNTNYAQGPVWAPWQGYYNPLTYTDMKMREKISPNVATGKPVTNLGPTSPGYVSGPPDKVTDGNREYDGNTMWYPGTSSIALQIDLGAPKNLKEITAWWHVYGCTSNTNYNTCSNGYDYLNNWNIQVSPNGSSWTTVGSGGAPGNLSTTADGTFNNVRYIYIYGSTAFHWLGLFEVEAIENVPPPPLPGQTPPPPPGPAPSQRLEVEDFQHTGHGGPPFSHPEPGTSAGRDGQMFWTSNTDGVDTAILYNAALNSTYNNLRVGARSDRWDNGDGSGGYAQMRVEIENVATGTRTTVFNQLINSTSHQTFTISGLNVVPGTYNVRVFFTNDAYGGSPGTDRNLHADYIEFEGGAPPPPPSTNYPEPITSTTMAEKFHFAPELFFGEPVFRPRTSRSSNDFGTAQSYTSLPPIF